MDNTEALKRAISIIHEASDRISAALPDQLAMPRLKVTSQLKNIANMLSGLAGFGVQSSEVATPLGPVTEVLGTKIERKQNHSIQDVQISEDMRAKFLKERDDLFVKFLQEPDDALLFRLTLPNGSALMRSVAKKAGYPDYKEADINVDFLQMVKSLIKAQQEADEAAAAAEAEAQKIKAQQEADEAAAANTAANIADTQAPSEPATEKEQKATNKKNTAK